VIAQLVTDAGCDIGQGWLYGRAVSPDIFLADLEGAFAATSAAPLA
jgi:EAL domain-containing protein (putative c-di-GMP-specific phosphodiesterase class I)